MTRPALRFPLALTLGLLGGCSTLPSSGPTAGQIVRAEQRLDRFAIRPVDATTVETLAAAPASGTGQLAALALDGNVDAIGPGDVLQIAIYEVGSSLFGGRVLSSNAFTPATGSGETLPPVTVGRDGEILLPWIGRLVAQGKTPDQLAREIVKGYRRNSENPQAVVSVRDNVSNAVVVQGDVAKPGRLGLTLAREHVLDAVAIAGGTSHPGADSFVRVSRGGRWAEMPLSAIAPGAPDDLALLPQDRISVSFRPRSFTVLGAGGKPSEQAFSNTRVSLAEALGRFGGPSDTQADPSAVFVFRYEPADASGAPLEGARPVAYRINMREPESYFLAQRFEMHPRDVIYVANAGANLPTKAIQILNLFFSPIYTAKVLSQ